MSHGTDAQAERNEAHHARALKALRPSDVLATVDDLAAQIPDVRHHPVDELVAHCPRYGGGKRPYMSEMVRASYDPFIGAAITRVVEEKSANFSMGEESPWRSARP